MQITPPSLLACFGISLSLYMLLIHDLGMGGSQASTIYHHSNSNNVIIIPDFLSALFFLFLLRLEFASANPALLMSSFGYRVNYLCLGIFWAVTGSVVLLSDFDLPRFHQPINNSSVF